MPNKGINLESASWDRLDHKKDWDSSHHTAPCWKLLCFVLDNSWDFFFKEIIKVTKRRYMWKRVKVNYFFPQPCVKPKSATATSSMPPYITGGETEVAKTQISHLDDIVSEDTMSSVCVCVFLKQKTLHKGESTNPDNKQPWLVINSTKLFLENLRLQCANGCIIIR